MSQALVPTNQTEIKEVWQQMGQTRKIGVIALAIATLTGLIFFFSWAQTPDYSVAFADLDSADGAAVVQYLQDNSIPYQITAGGGTISVPADQVHEIRLALAGQGLPGKGSVGMELFDSTNIGMTDFVQQVNYQRALEGELARTISNLNSVKSARVHIVIPQPTLFSEEELPTTGSVVLELESGQQLNKEKVQAISHLVSSAVEGLTPNNLTIVDMNGHVLSSGAMQDNLGVAASTSQIEAQRAFEKDMELRIETMLRNVLGPGKAVVRVTSEMNWDQVETESESYTPGEEDGVLRSSREIYEAYPNEDETAGGVPGTASNIPDAAPSFQTEISGTNSSGYQRTDVTKNFEVSRSTSKIKPATGTIERLSVSVMVDNITDTVTLGTIEQATIAAAGIDQTRGDVLSINSIRFDRSFEQEQAQAMQEIEQQEFYLNVAKWAAVAIALIALFFVVRSLQRSLRSPSITVEADDRKALEQSQANLLEKVGQAGGQLGEDLLSQIGPPQFSEGQKAAAEKAQMIRQLQLMAKNRPETLAQIIQFWLTEDGKGRV